MLTTQSILITGCSADGTGAKLASHPDIAVLSLDVTSTPLVTEAAKAVSESGRGLDILVNNAAFGYTTPVLDIDIDEAKKVQDTNLCGSVRTIQVFKDLLIASYGRIINFKVITAVFSLPWDAAYKIERGSLDVRFTFLSGRLD